MKRFSLVLILSVLSIGLSLDQDNEISFRLWYRKYFGQVSQLDFPSEELPNDLIVLNSKGVLSKIDASTGFVFYQKNLDNPVSFSSNEKDFITLDKITGDVNIFSLSNGQLHNNIRSTNSTIFKGEAFTLKSPNKNLGILLTAERVKIFDNNKVLFDSKSKENFFFYDYYINNDDNTAFVLAKNTTYNVYSIPLKKGSKLNHVVELDFNKKFTDSFITKENVFFFTNEEVEIYSIKTGKKIDRKLIHGKISQYYLMKNDDTIIAHMTDSNLNFLSQNLNFTKKYEGKCSAVKKTLFCFKKKENELLYGTFEISKTPIVKEGSFPLKDNEVVAVALNKFNMDTVAVATEKNIYLYSIKNPKKEESSHSHIFSDIIYSELIAFSPVEYESKNASSYTTFNQIGQKDFGAIVSNFIISLKNDLVEISTLIKEKVLDLLQKSKDLDLGKILSPAKAQIKEKESKNIKHTLFLFTNNYDLITLNAFNGETLFTKSFFKEKLQLIKIEKPNIIIRNKDLMFIEMTFKSDKKVVKYHYDLINNTLLEINTNTGLDLEKIVTAAQDELLASKGKISAVNISKKIPVVNEKISEKIKLMNDKYSLRNINNQITGFKYTLDNKNELYVSIAYNMKFEEIISYFTPKIHQYSNPTYFGEGKIFYKYIDPNLIIVLSHHSHKHLVVTLFHGETGKIIEKIEIKNVKLESLSYSFEENWGILSYIKREKGFIRNEIFAIELLKEEIEVSLIKIFQKKLSKLQGVSSSGLKAIHADDVTILSHSFALNRHPKQIYTSKTEFNNANKFIIMLLENNQIFLMDRRTFSPRRPLLKKVGKKYVPDETNSIYIDKDLPGYAPIVDLDFKFLINTELHIMSEIENVLTSPTEKESTFMTCLIGGDLSCYIVYPDKLYDRLSPNYSFLLMTLFISTFCIITFGIRKYVKKQEFKNIFIQN